MPRSFDKPALILKEQLQLLDQRALHPPGTASWLHAFSFLRNLCAHHALLWNR